MGKEKPGKGSTSFYTVRENDNEFGWGLSTSNLGCSSSSFAFFNPIQTQLFKTLYEKNNNTLISAPPGSGKLVCAELAVLHTLSSSSEGYFIIIV
jgi:replicative superfamily II helicase